MSNEPVAWIYDVQTPDGVFIKDWVCVGDEYKPSGKLTNVRPLYANACTALLRQALEALEIYAEHDPEGNGVADTAISALRERLGEKD